VSQQNVHIEVWESLGRQDPDWAVEARPDKRYGGWSEDLAGFYQSGEDRVREALALIPHLEYGRAVDYGSGTGRLSFALATRFDEVTCVDISRSMLALLRERAAERGIANLNPTVTEDFLPRGDSDLALSLITLQHFPSRKAVAEALRSMVASLRPGGKLLVEIPLRPHTLRYRMQLRLHAYRVLRTLGIPPTTLHTHGLSGMRMLWIRRSWVARVLDDAGAQVLLVHERRGTSHQQAYYVAERWPG
jgi:SAM-dependent methyltransferase